MTVLFNRTFLKELANVPSKTRIRIEQLVFEDINTFSSYTESPSLKKLSGHNHYYRVRRGRLSAGC